MKPFEPRGILKNHHLQTILPKYMPSKKYVPVEIEQIKTPDNDFFELFWFSKKQLYSSELPIIVIFHGLEGGLQSHYVQQIVTTFKQAGWICVLMTYRGCGNLINHTAKAYHAGKTEDIRLAIEHIRGIFTENFMLGVGISLGGSMLTHTLARFTQNPLLTAATLVSVPFNLAKSLQKLQTGLAKYYQRYLLTSLKQKAWAKKNLLKPIIGGDIEKIKTLKTIKAFDDLITAPLYGFRDANDYFERCSAINIINGISIDTLIIQAEDDPMVDNTDLEDYPFKSYINLELTRHGGHVGFIQGKLVNPQPWLPNTILHYWQSYLN